MEHLNSLELAALERLLCGDHPALAALRKQAERARVKARSFTGVGFFAELVVPSDVPRASIPNRVVLDEAWADIEGLKRGAGFVLFVEQGVISLLEGFSVDEPWPETIGKFKLRPVEERRRDLSRLDGPTID